MIKYDHLVWSRLLLVPLLIALLLFVLSYGTDFDFVWASFWFDLQGDAWVLRHHWLTETVLHQWVRALNQGMILLLLVLWSWRHFIQSVRGKQQRAFGLLLLSLLLSFATVAWLKRLLPMQCPWDLQQFGGQSAFWGLFDTDPNTAGANQCFPAGHASIGFAWLALYYYWLALKPQSASRGIAIGLTLGLLLGFVQQLRGAHFISHDIASAAVCWTVSTVIYLLFGASPGTEQCNRAEQSANSMQVVTMPVVALARAISCSNKTGVDTSGESCDV